MIIDVNGVAHPSMVDKNRPVYTDAFDVTRYNHPDTSTQSRHVHAVEQWFVEAGARYGYQKISENVAAQALYVASRMDGASA